MKTMILLTCPKATPLTLRVTLIPQRTLAAAVRCSPPLEPCHVTEHLRNPAPPLSTQISSFHYRRSPAGKLPPSGGPDVGLHFLFWPVMLGWTPSLWARGPLRPGGPWSGTQHSTPLLAHSCLLCGLLQPRCGSDPRTAWTLLGVRADPTAHGPGSLRSVLWVARTSGGTAMGHEGGVPPPQLGQP